MSALSVTGFLSCNDADNLISLSVIDVADDSLPQTYPINRQVIVYPR